MLQGASGSRRLIFLNLLIISGEMVMKTIGCHECISLKVFEEMHGFEYGPAEIITECSNKNLDAEKWYLGKGDELNFKWSNDMDRCPGFELK